MPSPRTLERFPQTFEDVVNAERGQVFCDEFEDNIRFVILRGGSSLCAYLGIPKAHPLAGFDYDSLPLDAHGGLTFSGEKLLSDTAEDGMWWYGWDYAHSGDRSAYDHGREGRIRDEKEWTVAEVYDDAWHAKWDFEKLVKLAERIARNGWQPAWKRGGDA